MEFLSGLIAGCALAAGLGGWGSTLSGFARLGFKSLRIHKAGGLYPPDSQDWGFDSLHIHMAGCVNPSGFTDEFLLVTLDSQDWGFESLRIHRAGCVNPSGFIGLGV